MYPAKADFWLAWVHLQNATVPSVNWCLAQRIANLVAWWHLLSLDAPTVAALWAWFFAHAMHLHFSPLQAFPLALATWLLYVGDRILDGLHPTDIGRLRERHHFHARHRVTFLIVGALLFVSLAWPLITHMRAEALRDDLFLGVAALLYLLAVHRFHAPRLPKELAVALLFAAGTAIPAWSRLGAWPGKEQLAPAVLFFAGLCWVNCVGIEKWESGQVNTLSHWAGVHLRAIVTMIALFALAAALLAPSRGLMAVYLSAVLSSVLLFTLDARSSHLPPLYVRIAADAALLTPLALLPVGR
jgi:hypothetical protein